uniref:Uncharacterized protein n=1 Tax=Lygus hesperus TaxID=30085 RepID=A0A0K8T5N6_LYGHE
MEAKFRVFCSVARAILCYASQVWGFSQYRVVEQVQRHFIKMVMGLPRNTPDYIIYLESEVEPIFVHTLVSHCRYVLKILEMPAARLPRLVALEVIQRSLFWFNDVSGIAAALMGTLKTCLLGDPGLRL